MQLDEVLTALQSPQRQDLSELLEGFGTALDHQPTAAEDLTQDPDVQGLSAAEALNKTFDYGEAAGKNTAIVNQAFLGTEPHDLSGLLRGTSRFMAALASREQQLSDLLTNFNTTTGALADESDNLSETVRLLAPTLTTARSSLLHLNEALPFLRTFAIELRPGSPSCPPPSRPPIRGSTRPSRCSPRASWACIAKQLRKGTPGLAGAAGAGLEALPSLKQAQPLREQRPGPDRRPGDHRRFQHRPAQLTGRPSTGSPSLAGESQNFDGNGPYVRFQSGGGPVKVRAQQPRGRLPRRAS